MENRCPKCNGSNTYVDKKGFSGKKAVAGALLVGPIGAAAGTIGSNKIKITCLDCGYSYFAGEYSKAQKGLAQNGKPIKMTAGGWMVFSFIFSFFTFLIWLIFDSLFFGIQSAVFFGTFLLALIIKIATKEDIAAEANRREQEYEKLFAQKPDVAPLSSINQNAPQKVNQKAQCLECGALNELGVHYCRMCGKEIDYKSLDFVRDGALFEYTTCPNCESKTPIPSRNTHFCVNCGKEILTT